MYQTNLDLTEFKIKETFNGENNKILIFNCSKCEEKDKDFFTSRNCLRCFFYNFLKNKERNIDSIEISKINLNISKDIINIIQDFFNILDDLENKIYILYENIEKARLYGDSELKSIEKFQTKLKKIYKEKDFIPTELYKFLSSYIIKFESKRINTQNYTGDISCFIRSIKKPINLMKKTTFIKFFQKYKELFYEFKIKNQSFYQVLFKNPTLLKANIEKNRQKNPLTKKFVKSYFFGPFNLYNVQIYRKPQEVEFLYKLKLNFDSNSNENYYLEISKRVIENMEIENYFSITPIEILIKKYQKNAHQIILDQYNFEKPISEKLSFFIAVKKIKLNKIFPLLMDDYIEEIFLDAEDNNIYLNHQLYERCRTNATLKKREFERLKTLLRLYSGKRIDYNHPTIKYVIKNRFFFIRFAIDISPIHLNNYCMDIRKLDKKILNIQDLLKNSTLNPRMAAFLYFCILKRKNIMITGETDTGKTTLINALDLLSPKSFRKIYIENIPESIEQGRFGKHQLKYQVNSLDDQIDNKITKSNFIKTLLHRSPDIIYLGEILTKEEAEAMFHCFASGLRGFQTIHAKSINSLINRFLYHFNINKFCLDDLDLIILMKKEKNRRFIAKIVEIKPLKKGKKIQTQTLFEYNPYSNNSNEMNIFKSNTIQLIRKYERLSEEKFRILMKLYTDIFLFLKRNTKLSNLTLVDLFHNISYYSLRKFKLSSLKEILNELKRV